MAQRFLARCADGRCTPIEIDGAASELNIKGPVRMS